MIIINCEDRSKKRKIDLPKVKKIAKKVLKTFKKNNVELDIIFVSNQKMRALNHIYCGKDAATDVLAFSPAEKKPEDWPAGCSRKIFLFHGANNAEGRQRFLGDIAISSDKAFYSAKIYGTSFKYEIALYVIHGILHLLGYGDTTDKKRAVMRKEENELLKKIRKFL